MDIRADQPVHLPLQLGRFDLQPGCRASCSFHKDLQDQIGAVEHLPVENVFELAHLHDAQIGRENDRVDRLFVGKIESDFLAFSFSDIRGARDSFHILIKGVFYLDAGRSQKVVHFFFLFVSFFFAEDKDCVHMDPPVFIIGKNRNFALKKPSADGCKDVNRRDR